MSARYAPHSTEAVPLGRDGKGNDNSYGNNNSYSYSFNRISRIVPDQVACYV